MYFRALSEVFVCLLCVVLHKEVGVGASPENERGRKLDKTIMPQLFSLDERVERLASDLRELKRSQESDHARKVDREEHQLVAMRLAAFEKFEPNQVTSQIEVLENMSKTHQHALDLMNTQLRQACDIADSPLLSISCVHLRQHRQRHLKPTCSD